MRVRVHQNLRTRLWTITALDGPRKGYKVGEASRVTLADCEFHVSEARRQWTIRHKARQVHAWVIGTLCAPEAAPCDAQDFTYNPYRAGYFHKRGDVNAIVRNARRAYFDGSRACASGCI